MKNKKFLVVSSLFVIASLALAACGGGGDGGGDAGGSGDVAAIMEDPAGFVEISEGESVKIGLAMVLSGAPASLGLDTAFGAEVAVAQRDGEVLGFPIETIRGDDLCNAEGGVTVAQQFTADEDMTAVIGDNCSSACTPSAEIYSAAGVLQFSPSCTAPALTTGDAKQPFFLRTAHNDAIQGRVAAEFALNELGVTSAATIHDGSPYAEQLQQVFADNFVELGGTITSQQAINVGDTDFRALLADMATDGPELLFYPIFLPEGALLTNQARETAGMEDIVLMGADGLLTPDFVDSAGDDAEGVYMTGPSLNFGGDVYQTFLADYLEAAGTEPTAAFHAHAFDAVNIVLDAIEAVGVVDGGTLYIGRTALRDYVAATDGYEGITGTLTCDEFGDCADAVIQVNLIEGGEVFNPVYESR